jgi:hypothetical protein
MNIKELDNLDEKNRINEMNNDIKNNYLNENDKINYHEPQIDLDFNDNNDIKDEYKNFNNNINGLNQQEININHNINHKSPLSSQRSSIQSSSPKSSFVDELDLLSSIKRDSGDTVNQLMNKLHESNIAYKTLEFQYNHSKLQVQALQTQEQHIRCENSALSHNIACNEQDILLLESKLKDVITFEKNNYKNNYNNNNNNNNNRNNNDNDNNHLSSNLNEIRGQLLLASNDHIQKLTDRIHITEASLNSIKSEDNESILKLNIQNKVLRGELKKISEQLASRTVLYTAQERRTQNQARIYDSHTNENNNEIIQLRAALKQLQIQYDKTDSDKIEALLQNKELDSKNKLLQLENDENEEKIKLIDNELSEANLQNLDLQTSVNNLKGYDMENVELGFVNEIERIREDMRLRELSLRKQVDESRHKLVIEAQDKKKLLDEIENLRVDLNDKTTLLSQINDQGYSVSQPNNINNNIDGTDFDNNKFNNSIEDGQSLYSSFDHVINEHVNKSGNNDNSQYAGMFSVMDDDSLSDVSHLSSGYIVNIDDNGANNGSNIDDNYNNSVANLQKNGIPTSTRYGDIEEEETSSDYILRNNKEGVNLGYLIGGDNEENTIDEKSVLKLNIISNAEENSEKESNIIVNNNINNNDNKLITNINEQDQINIHSNDAEMDALKNELIFMKKKQSILVDAFKQQGSKLALVLKRASLMVMPANNNSNDNPYCNLNINNHDEVENLKYIIIQKEDIIGNYKTELDIKSQQVNVYHEELQLMEERLSQNIELGKALVAEDYDKKINEINNHLISKEERNNLNIVQLEKQSELLDEQFNKINELNSQLKNEKNLVLSISNKSNIMCNTTDITNNSSEITKLNDEMNEIKNSAILSKNQSEQEIITLTNKYNDLVLLNDENSSKSIEYIGMLNFDLLGKNRVIEELRLESSKNIKTIDELNILLTNISESKSKESLNVITPTSIKDNKDFNDNKEIEYIQQEIKQQKREADIALGVESMWLNKIQDLEIKWKIEKQNLIQEKDSLIVDHTEIINSIQSTFDHKMNLSVMQLKSTQEDEINIIKTDYNNRLLIQQNNYNNDKEIAVKAILNDVDDEIIRLKSLVESYELLVESYEQSKNFITVKSNKSSFDSENNINNKSITLLRASSDQFKREPLEGVEAQLISKMKELEHNWELEKMEIFENNTNEKNLLLQEHEEIIQNITSYWQKEIKAKILNLTEKKQNEHKLLYNESKKLLIQQEEEHKDELVKLKVEYNQEINKIKNELSNSVNNSIDSEVLGNFNLNWSSINNNDEDQIIDEDLNITNDDDNNNNISQLFHQNKKLLEPDDKDIENIDKIKVLKLSNYINNNTSIQTYEDNIENNNKDIEIIIGNIRNDLISKFQLELDTKIIKVKNDYDEKLKYNKKKLFSKYKSLVNKQQVKFLKEKDEMVELIKNECDEIVNDANIMFLKYNNNGVTNNIESNISNIVNKINIASSHADEINNVSSTSLINNDNDNTISSNSPPQQASTLLISTSPVRINQISPKQSSSSPERVKKKNNNNNNNSNKINKIRNNYV